MLLGNVPRRGQANASARDSPNHVTAAMKLLKQVRLVRHWYADPQSLTANTDIAPSHSTEMVTAPSSGLYLMALLTRCSPLGIPFADELRLARLDAHTVAFAGFLVLRGDPRARALPGLSVNGSGATRARPADVRHRPAYRSRPAFAELMPRSRADCR